MSKSCATRLEPTGSPVRICSLTMALRIFIFRRSKSIAGFPLFLFCYFSTLIILVLKIIYHLLSSMSIPFINYLLFLWEFFFTEKKKHLTASVKNFRTGSAILHKNLTVPFDTLPKKRNSSNFRLPLGLYPCYDNLEKGTLDERRSFYDSFHFHRL